MHGYRESSLVGGKHFLSLGVGWEREGVVNGSG